MSERTLERGRATSPNVQVNQRWESCNDAGEVLRRVRVLAPHPDGGWILCDEPSKLVPRPYGMTVCPEFNLRYVFELAASPREGKD